MPKRALWLIAFMIGVFSTPAISTYAQTKEDAAAAKPDAEKQESFKATQQASKGSVTVEGTSINYDAYAGTFVVHMRDWDDVPQNADKNDKVGPAEASMFYVAYIKSGEAGTSRPVTFLYNGGPGSSTVWLHMGAFGPKRVVTLDDSHTPAAPYPFINNDFSLLDASDLVFIDAPGTGFSRVAGKDKEKAFYTIDDDAHAFADFIAQFLTKYQRWNSPKYLFGESYGTTRSAVLVNQLETEHDVDFNGVILLSQILSFDNSADAPEFNPGMDLPYLLALPTYAATAWYHHKLPQTPPPALEALLPEVENFAMTDYARALSQGSELSATDRDAIATKLHQYTGLPIEYIKKADLRVNAGEFEKMLQDETNTTTGRLDSRFSGPTMDPLSKEADYDPQSAAISSAYVSAFNDYVRRDLKYTDEKQYKPEVGVWRTQGFLHSPPGVGFQLPQSANVMLDLAMAMKYNPDLKVLLNAGYFDLATPFFEGVYEMHHLPIPQKLESNIEFKFYQSGHMVYAHQASLKELHDNVASFITRTENSKSK
jgi:carboxypeptidase C (cathepsin A)